MSDSPHKREAIHFDGTHFTLHGENVSYVFHIDQESGDLISDHFGGPVSGSLPMTTQPVVKGFVGLPGRVRREFPEEGRGDFRTPAVRIRQSQGHVISNFQYDSYTIVPGKPPLPGLPATFGDEEDVTTLIVHLYDKYSSVSADLYYSIFPRFDAIVRSVRITNQGQGNIIVESLSSLSVDLPFQDLDMISLSGDWARETHRARQRVGYGIQGFGSSAGFSSHQHNPFVSLVQPSATETQGEAWGFSLVYTGSFSINVEKCTQGFTRVLAGFNPHQLSWQLSPTETLSSPECVSVYSQNGIGGMSRSYHGLFRKHLIKSQFVTRNRPVLLNSWEGLHFDFDQAKIIRLAEQSAALGVELFVLDDGWFGNEFPRVSEDAGLGDWELNRSRFPGGLEALVNSITQLKPPNASGSMKFGIWIEPEMVSPNSTLHRAHPDWVLHADQYPRTLKRSQLLLNLALPEVQNFIIESVTHILNSADISYVKWDHNRAMHEAPSPSTHHKYILGMYHVLDTLISRFPNILWEGCASGGGRFDPGLLPYFPQSWTSDSTDAVERLWIQLGASLAYPASVMGGHISAVPNKWTGRSVSIEFRGHVAMMCGSFGLELDLEGLAEDDKASLSGLIALSKVISPIVLNGDMWRLSLPEESNWPAVLFVSGDHSRAVLFYFQLCANVNHATPRVRLRGLDSKALYVVDTDKRYSGSTLMNMGLEIPLESDYQSRVVVLERN